jgi:E3 ubiquitin-protein ligase DOA10
MEQGEGVATYLTNMEQGEGVATCRFCLETGSAEGMIAPCLCAGTSQFVHRACLDEWRAQESMPRAFTHCPSCKFQYLTDIPPEDHRERRCALWRFRLFVARWVP